MTTLLCVQRNPANVLAHLGSDLHAPGRTEPTEDGELNFTRFWVRIVDGHALKSSAGDNAKADGARTGGRRSDREAERRRSMARPQAAKTVSASLMRAP